MRIDPNLPLSQKRAIAGQLGGRRNVKLHGKRHMKKIGRWGAHVMHSQNALIPVALNDFAITCRTTGQVKALLSGKPIKDVFGTSSVVLPIPTEESEEFA